MIYIAIGKMGSGKYTWIEKTIKKRKNKYCVLEIRQHQIADIEETIYYANGYNYDIYISAVDIEHITEDIKKKADKIKIFH